MYLHGLGWTSAAVFAHIVAQPALAGHRSLLIDLPGHGLSDRPARFGTCSTTTRLPSRRCSTQSGFRGRPRRPQHGRLDRIVLAARRPDLVARLVVAEANLDPLPPSPTGLGSQQISSYPEAAWVSAAFEEFVAANPEWAPTLNRCDRLAIHRSAVGLIVGTRPTMRELLLNLPIPRTFIRGQHGKRSATAEHWKRRVFGSSSSSTRAT